MKTPVLFASLALVCPISAIAQWTPGVWPACANPREIRAQVQDCYSGVVERTQACYGYAPSAPAWYRTFGGDVQALKDALVAHSGPWADPSLAVSGSFDSWFGTTNAAPVFTWATLCESLEIPTNFMFYTPPRSDLAGLGGNTNDADVIGNGHGYVNSETAKGGAVFPSGRSCWYTTDYGLDNLRKVISALNWSWNVPFHATPLRSGSDYYGLGYSVYWGTAMANAEAAFAPRAGSGSLAINGTMGSGPDFWFVEYAEVERSRWYLSLANSVSWPRDVTIDTYLYAQQIRLYDAVTSEWDDLGSGLRDQTYTRQHIQVTTGESAGYTTDPYGDVTIPSTWCINPYYAADYSGHSSRGYVVTLNTSSGSPTVAKWTFSFAALPGTLYPFLWPSGGVANVSVSAMGRLAPVPPEGTQFSMLSETGGAQIFTVQNGKLVPAGNDTIYSILNPSGGVTRFRVSSGLMVQL